MRFFEMICLKRISIFAVGVVLIAAIVGCVGGVDNNGDGSYTLIVDFTTGGTVTVDGLPIPGKAILTYHPGTAVSLNATPSAGYRFGEWTGNVSSIADVNAGSTSIVMRDDYSIMANFEAHETDVNPVVHIPSAVKVQMGDGSVEIMNLDEYVKGVVAAEMFPDWPMEALEAQAVAARTFAVTNTHHDHGNVDVCTDHNRCQAWKSPPYDVAIVDAVASTTSEVITYNGTIVREALYFSHCDGHTRDSEDYSGWDYVPYLRGVPCGCADAYGWTEHNSHGVGMCQYGAQVMAEQGFTYADILNHYYTDIAITSAHTG
jgi:peptidoglycan hydrolase-like amidase